MRHPLSTSRRGFEGSGAVCSVFGLVVEDADAQAVPEDFEPAVAQGAQCGVVGFACSDLGIVELPRPGGLLEAAKRPLLDGFAEIAVAGQAAFILYRTYVIAGDRPQLRPDLAVRDQLAQLGVGVEGEQAADPGVFGVVLLLRRAAAAFPGGAR
jgi:hypothetical protein